MPTGPSLSDDALRTRACTFMDNGNLPLAITTRLHASYGAHNSCILCGEAITPQHIEYEVNDPRDRKRLLFHVRCHHEWQLACLHRTFALSP